MIDKSKIKIACIYNMNNNMFTLARFLKDEGYDTEVLLVNEDEHFQPSNDTFSEQNDIKIVKTGWIDNEQWMSTVTKNNVLNKIKGYNLIIGCGYTPAFLELVNKKLDIFIPYGSDFYWAPFENVKVYDKSKFDQIYPKLQYRGIENSRHVIFDFTTDQEPVFKKFNLKGQRHYFFPPVFYSREFNDIEISKFYSFSKLYPIIKKLRLENDLLFIQHCRQSWKNPQDEFSNKRNDILIRAFKKFVSQHPDKKTKLILLEYGIDIDATKELIHELDLNDHIFWLPKSPRKELMIVLSMVDLGIAELGLSFLMYGTVGEFMMMKVPFILNCSVESFKEAYPELYPVNHANSEESCLQHFNNFLNDPSYYKHRASESQNWFNKYIIDIPLQKLTSIIDLESNKNWFQRLLNK